MNIQVKQIVADLFKTGLGAATCYGAVATFNRYAADKMKDQNLVVFVYLSFNLLQRNISNYLDKNIQIDTENGNQKKMFSGIKVIVSFLTANAILAAIPTYVHSGSKFNKDLFLKNFTPLLLLNGIIASTHHLIYGLCSKIATTAAYYLFKSKDPSQPAN